MIIKWLCDFHEGSHLLAENGNNWIHVEFSNYCVLSYLCVCVFFVIGRLSMLQLWYWMKFHRFTKQMLPTSTGQQSSTLSYCYSHHLTLKKKKRSKASMTFYTIFGVISTILVFLFTLWNETDSNLLWCEFVYHCTILQKIYEEMHVLTVLWKLWILKVQRQFVHTLDFQPYVLPVYDSQVKWTPCTFRY